MKIFELQAMDAVRPAKSLDQVSAIQCLMSLQNCSACLWHCHGPIRAGLEARLSKSLGFCAIHLLRPGTSRVTQALQCFPSKSKKDSSLRRGQKGALSRGLVRRSAALSRYASRDHCHQRNPKAAQK